MNQAPRRRWGWTATVPLVSLAFLYLPALCQAQTPPTYTVSTIAGSIPPGTGKNVIPTAGYGGDGNLAISATLNGPASVAIDSSGNMYIADQVNNVIRAVSASTGKISTVAGTNVVGYGGDGGPAISAQIQSPDTIILDSKGNFYFSDVTNSAIRWVNASTHVIQTYAGAIASGTGFSGDGAAATASALNRPSGIAFDSAGNMYLSDTGNERIREVTLSNGFINTIVGDGQQGYLPVGGAALSAHLNGPRAIAIASNGDIYFADSFNNQIRKVSAGVISLVAGSPTALFGYSGDGGLATNALLNDPTGIALDSSGNLYICDTYNDVIRMVTPDGNIHTIAGAVTGPTPGYSGDGGPALSALFNEPESIVVDSAGNLYVCDYGNDIVRKLVPSTKPGGGLSAPAIKSGGVITASGYGGQSAIAPGTWIEIYGANLASTTRQWAASDFSGINAPTGLNQTTVSVGGQAAFVEYISANQVNAQVPGNIGLGTQPVVVSTPGGASAAYNVTVNLQEPALLAPAVFSDLFNGQTVQWVTALFTDLSTYVFPTNAFNGVTSRPAKPGDTIVFYGIGFAPVPGNPPGQIPQTANGLTLPIAPNFYFNGVQAQVTYAGLAPNFIGLYQFNVVVPPVPGLVVGTPTAVKLTFTVNENGTQVAGTQTFYTAVEN
jgi:uncharacterized protein (TIGR03437 family)